MTLLSINHGAKGVVMWTWPTSPPLSDVSTQFAKLATGAGPTFWLGAVERQIQVIQGALVDAAVWVVGDQMMVSVVNVGGDVSRSVVVILPDGIVAQSVKHVFWAVVGGRYVAVASY